MISIAGRKIGPEHPPFIVAELSANHRKSLDVALKLVEAAKHAGAHAIKLQTFTPETMTLDSDSPEFVHDSKSLWKGKSLYQLYEEAFLPWEWHAPIFKRCRELDLIAFSTPFDESAVNFLEDLGAPCYKIASLEIVDLPLIECVAKTRKPLIISTGAATLKEIEEAVQTARDHGCEDLVLLKCTSAYPANATDAHLKTLQDLATRFGCLVGLSDHILNNAPAIASIVLGGCLIEKHFTLDRSVGGLDAAFSLEPEGMKQLVDETLEAWKALGKVYYGVTEAEKSNHAFRRSIYFIQDMEEGQIISEEDIQAIRPGYGLPPKHYKSLIGKKVAKSVKRGQPTSWDLIKN